MIVFVLGYADASISKSKHQ